MLLNSPSSGRITTSEIKFQKSDHSLLKTILLVTVSISDHTSQPAIHYLLFVIKK